jgi:hypothetical protein
METAFLKEWKLEGVKTTAADNGFTRKKYDN